MLIVTGLEAGYGKSRVLFDINLTVADGQLVTLMGRNGMGKTTTVRSIMGLIRPTAGTIRLDEEDISRASPERVARLGVGLVPEGRRVFRTLTVRENLVATSANRLRRAEPWTLKRVCDLFPRLGERINQRAGTLSGGEQQMLAIGRALMTNPRLLILDEATEGLAPLIRAEIWSCIERLKGEGQSILLIDKNLHAVKPLATKHFIIEKGRTVWTGTSAELDADHEQTSRYIGL
ncbi:ABC transporter ATP-binding protein [Acuticoccus kandeliae]|uniref:ABC transporter ATP-binding protein n=1 Tax=Acuticoccus kandeliae TaxID=2073160 RepID=UPI000D3E47FC|nr:ABC transporter ATP-binding protein [Acuticoccus kandeliae]